jgi:hypothetical protein
MALGLDLARDLEGGEAASLNLAGRLAGVTVFARDSEYQGIFYDEDQRSGIAGGTFLRRSTELRLDWVERVFRLGSGIPMSFDVQRDEKQDGATSTTADARFSMTPGGLFLSSSLRYSRTTGHEGASDVLAGAIDSSRLLAANWQVRGGLQYALLPQPEAQSVFVTVDHALSARNSIRLSISQALSTDFSTSVQLADTWRLDRAALSFAAGFDSQRRDFRLGVQLSFGLLFDPTRGRYRISRPGVTSGGDAVFTAFIDSNGDGRRETGEPALANLKLEVPGPKVVTDATGQALVSGLGASAAARIRVKTDDLDEPYAVPPADVVEFRPRPGRVTQIFYGLKPVGEVQLRLTIRRSGGQPKGVSGLDVQLLSAGNVVAAEGHTEYDGTMFVEKLPPGPYDVRIDPDQSKRLGLRLAKPLVVRVPPAGGFLGNVDGTVEAVS